MKKIIFIIGVSTERAQNSVDVAPAILYLASEYNGFITGATSAINGGVYNV